MKSYEPLVLFLADSTKCEVAICCLLMAILVKGTRTSRKDLWASSSVGTPFFMKRKSTGLLWISLLLFLISSSSLKRCVTDIMICFSMQQKEEKNAQMVIIDACTSKRQTFQSLAAAIRPICFRGIRTTFHLDTYQDWKAAGLLWIGWDFCFIWLN